MTDKAILEKLMGMLPKEKEGAIAPYVKEIRYRTEILWDTTIVIVRETEQADTLGEFTFRFYHYRQELSVMRYKQIPAKG